MNPEKDQKDDEETFEGLVYQIIYHTGVFVFKIMLIVSLWVFALDFLKKILL